MIKTFIKKSQSKFKQFNGPERMTMKFMILLDTFQRLYVEASDHI